MASEFAHQMREAELSLAARLLPLHCNVLELGAGDGWQSHALSQMGYKVTAVDVDAGRVGPSPMYPVTIYDGQTLPYADASFDVIYSSNVMEHVADFARIQGELVRVLRPGGYAVHCVPSAVWRFWTTMGHPLLAARTLFSIVAGRGNAGSVVLQDIRRASSTFARVGRLIRLGLASPRHGEHGTLLSEHFSFSRSGWTKRFDKTGWIVQNSEPTGIFYSGNELWGTRLSSTTRQVLASIMGSSTIIFTIAPREGIPNHDHST